RPAFLISIPSVRAEEGAACALSKSAPGVESASRQLPRGDSAHGVPALPNPLTSETRPAAYVPLPLRLMCCGVFGALSFRVTAPVRVPVAVGLNFTLIVQLAPPATVL